MKKQIFKLQANQVSAEANEKSTVVINGVTITKPLCEYTPEELGASPLAVLAYNCMKEDTPELFKLAGANDDVLTEYVMVKKAEESGESFGDIAPDLMTDAELFCEYFAEGVEEETALVKLDDEINHFFYESTKESYEKIVARAKAIAKTPKFTALMKVFLVGLRLADWKEMINN